MSDPVLQFRDFIPSDLAVLGPWLRREGFGVPAGVAGDMWGRRLVEDPRIVCQVALRGDEPVGFLRLDLAPDASAEITVLVAPGERRRGLGSAVLERALAEARCRGLRELVALVRVDNAGAAAFFVDAGFVSAGGARFVPAGGATSGFVPYTRHVHRAEHQPPLEIVP